MLDIWTARIACLAIGAFLPLVGPINSTLAVSVVLLPVWLRCAIRMRLAWVGLLGVLAILNGLVLTQVMSTGAREVSNALAIAHATLIICVATGAGTMVWARRVLGAGTMAALFGVGMLVGQMRVGLSQDNPWKYDLFVPVVLCVLGIAWARAWPRVELAAALLIAVVSLLNDSRSAAAIVVVGVVALVWQQIRVRLRMQSGPLRVAVTLGVMGMVTYALMESFILQGYLGAGTQARTEAQLRTSGSLLLGGRPELGATASLLQASPSGYGLGIVPDSSDLAIAKGGMASLGYDPNNGYVERYMFGQGMEVHSVVGDIWLACGILGLLFALTMIGIIVTSTMSTLTRGQAPALMIVLTLLVCWDAAFSPFYVTACQVLVVTLALTVGTEAEGNN